jgi:hypothetical protein
VRTIQRIEEFLKLWRVILPHLPEPSLRDAGRWAIYTDDAVEGAILRAGQRYSPERVGPAFDPTQAHRYVSIVSKALQLSPQATGATRPAPGTTERKDSHNMTNTTTTNHPTTDAEALAQREEAEIENIEAGKKLLARLPPNPTFGDMARLADAEQPQVAQ